MSRATAAKAKISVTVDASLVEEVDRGVRLKRYPSRSAAIEAALQRWSRQEHARRRDAEIEAYYLGMSAEERADDREWAQLAYAVFVELGRRDEPSPGPLPSGRKRGCP